MSVPTTFHLVEWEREENEKSSISIVPDKWLLKGTKNCRWPPIASSHLIRKQRCQQSPKKSWGVYPYSRIVKSSDNWEKIKHCKEVLLEKTDLETTDIREMDRPRKRKRASPANWDYEDLSPSSTPSSSESSASDRHTFSSSHFEDILSPPPELSQIETPRSRQSAVYDQPPSPSCQFASRSLFPRESYSQPLSSPLGSTDHEPISMYQMSRQFSPHHVSENGQSPVDYRPYFERLFKEMGEMKAILQQYAVTINELRSQKEEDVSRPDLPQGFEFPLKATEELERLNKVLATEAPRKCLVHYLYNLGGDSYRATIRVSGGFLMTPSLQGAYNFTGNNKCGKNKLGFSKLSNICLILHSVVQERHQVDKMKVNSYISEWLSTWRDRLAGGKMNRPCKQRSKISSADMVGEADVEEDNELFPPVADEAGH